MGKIWFTSDLHLGHKNILRLDNRPFGDIEAHDETIINNYNKLVAQDDIVYILGDILWNQSYESYKQLFNRLNGRKAIILGNHDNRQHLLRCCKEGLVLSVKESQIINIGKDSVFLSHYPHREWNGFYRGFYHLYGHCVDNETEILTTDGWKKFDTIKDTDIVLNLNLDTGLIEEDKINYIVSNNYTGKVYNFSVKGKVDLRVTDKHRMLTLNKKDKSYEIITAEEFAKCCSKHFIVAGVKDTGGLDLPDNMLKLLVWITADGSLCNTDLVRIRLHKKRKIEQLKILLQDIDIEYRELKQKDGSICFNFTLPKELNGYRFKPIDDRIIQCNKHQAEIIYETYSITDGKKYSDKCMTIYTSKLEETDILQRMFILNGYKCSINIRKNQGFKLKSGEEKISYEILVCKKYITENRQIQQKIVIEDVENEHFWCVNTNNGTIIVRRNGRVAITGNCHGSLEDYKQSTDVCTSLWEFEPVGWEEIKEYIDKNCEPNT